MSHNMSHNMNHNPLPPDSSPTLPRKADRPQVAIAILYQAERVLLQLRDDIPTIAHPGKWAFFGGHLDPGELPEAGVQRELLEEIGYRPPTIALFCSYQNDASVDRHVFAAPLTVEAETLQLNEGMDMGLVSYEEIQQGYCFSKRLQELRPIATPHQQILLEFYQARDRLKWFLHQH
jgi:8-oxo-dGTP diphosphatase